VARAFFCRLPLSDLPLSARIATHIQAKAPVLADVLRQKPQPSHYQGKSRTLIRSDMPNKMDVAGA
jgi:hypothetical protein